MNTKKVIKLFNCMVTSLRKKDMLLYFLVT